MTASLPMAHDPEPEEGFVRDAAPRPLPPLPDEPAEAAAERAELAARAAARPAKRPVKKRAPRVEKRRIEHVPQVPPRVEALIPPKPPLPTIGPPDDAALTLVPPPPPPLPADESNTEEPDETASTNEAPSHEQTRDEPTLPAGTVVEAPLKTRERRDEREEDAGLDPVDEEGDVATVPQDDLAADTAPSSLEERSRADDVDTAVAGLTEPFDDQDVDAAQAAVSLRGVVKLFGQTRAVDGIDLTIPPGAFYGLVGPNGAGKTTTLSLIAGLLRADRGSIRVGDVDAASDPRGAKRLMGVLPDRLRTFDRLTGRQLLHYYGALRGLPTAVAESRTRDLARAFDLADALGRPVADYSLGMTKKVMLAGAMIHSPRVLVLDEPFEAVDPVSSAVILEILQAYVAHGGTVILSSHGMDFVERVCTRVAVIVAGQVLAEGTVEEVRGELTLEQRFIELAGGLSDVEGLEWLHTFSD